MGAMVCYRCNTPLPDNSKFCLSCGADVSGETGERTVPMQPRISHDTDLGALLRSDVHGLFTVEREIGRGGMGAVFLATETQLGRKVAIKVLPPELTFSPAAVERFKREARTAATLDHPHIIPVHRVSTGETVFWYAMKYLEGKSLADLLEAEGAMTPERVAEITSQVAEALDYAHQHGVIHRDVKPSNIVIDARGWVTVTDFGIAKAVGAESITGSGSMIGTPYYMSPEQCSGLPVAASADQYSLGVVAFQMLTGRLPFEGGSVLDVVRRHMMEPVPSLRSLRVDLPSELQDVIERALAKEPGDRFGSVAAFADALKKVVRGERVSLGVTASRQLAARRRRYLLGGVGVAAIAVVAGVLLWPRGAGAPATSVATDTAGGGPAAVDTAGPVPSSVPPQAPEALGATAPLTLRGVPAGATVLVDGQRRAPGAPVRLAVGAAHSVVVSAAGFRPWRTTVAPRDTTPLVRTVAALQPDTGGAVQAPPAGEVAYITGGSNPAGAMYVNGQRQGGSSAFGVAVPAGLVRLRFVITDSAGSFNCDTTLAVAPGARVAFGRVRCSRP